MATVTSNVEGAMDDLAALSESFDVSLPDSKPVDAGATAADSLQRDKTSPTDGATTGAPVSVSLERKEQLLLEARAHRVKWILQVPLPYRQREDPHDPWIKERGLKRLADQCQAMSLMPSLKKLLSHLYGIDDLRVAPDLVASRVTALLEKMEGNSAQGNQGSGEKGRDLRVLLTMNNKSDPTLTSYHNFLNKLQTPECASLVQTMQNALRNLEDSQIEQLHEFATKLQLFIDSIFETIKKNPVWKTMEDDQQSILRALESFVFGQSYRTVQSYLWDESAIKAEKEWQERLSVLSFVNANHLDIPYLDFNDLRLVMDEPIQALLSVDQYFSPYQKLQRILAVYKSVNTTLTTAMNKSTGGDKLPSADDVLPAIILTVLLAKPQNMSLNLQMVETFCPADMLRGEAGYAYTNLYGAVQFLQDMEMTDPKSLSISPEDFRKGLEESREKLKQQQVAIKAPSTPVKMVDSTITVPDHVEIPLESIQEARTRGEEVNLAWALKWHEEKYGTTPFKAEKEDEIVIPLKTEDILPSGFTRNYSFLTARAEDIRMSDVPQLLEEYRMLVHVTEKLLADRSKKIAAERKKTAMQSRAIMLESDNA